MDLSTAINLISIQDGAIISATELDQSDWYFRKENLFEMGGHTYLYVGKMWLQEAKSAISDIKRQKEQSDAEYRADKGGYG